MKTKAPIILGSQSPRRQQLLKDLGFEFDVIVRSVEEVVEKDLHPRAVAVMISESKAKAFDDLTDKHIVITADTIVALEDEIMGKPTDKEDAADLLRKLSGNTHLVITGVTLFHKGRFKSFSEETTVTFRDLTEEEIWHYIRTAKPFDKAGAYGIQDWIGMIGITRIEGCYYNVMGLPLSKLYTELTQL